MSEENKSGTNGQPQQQTQQQYQQPQQQPTIIIQNTNTNQNSGVAGGQGSKAKNKWITLLLIFFGLGFFGAHKFYEGKIGLGIVYLFTGGIFGIGVFIDFWTTLFKPNPYYV